MNWINLIDEPQLNSIKELSKQRPQLIFKHSTRCHISTMVKTRLERTEQPGGIDFHYLDLIQYRQLSGKIAEDFGIMHESPQILLIKNGACIYDESHNSIVMDDIKEQAAVN
jgi:bacillithiol system protein YtxJ